MDELTHAFVPPSRIDLARETDFHVGALLIRPSRCEVEACGVRRSVQRRVMQVLVALARSTNQVVSQHELNLRCWGGLSVSDDAIGRCIWQLRRLAQYWPEQPFEITTIAGVGYRLEPMPIGGAVRHARVPRRRGPLLVFSGLLLVVVLAALIWAVRDWGPWSTPAAPSRVVVLPLDADGAGAQSFADSLHGKIVEALSYSQIQAVSEADSKALKGSAAADEIKRLGVGLLLEGAVRSDGETIDVRLHIDDAREHVAVWSDEFRGPARDPEALQIAVAAHAAELIYWAQVARSGPVKLEASSLAAFIAGRESTTMVRNGSNAAARTDYQRVVVASPDFSWGHSGVAMSDANALLDGQEAPEALRADARREAIRALALDRHNGEAYVALAAAAPTLDWRGREALLLQGIAIDPAFEPSALWEGRLQWFVGRGQAALGWLQRAHDINPLHNGASWSLALSLAAEGHGDAARGLAAQMQTQWPGDISTKLARFMVPVILGETDQPLALLADPATCPPNLDQRGRAAWEATLRAVAAKSESSRVRARSIVNTAAKTGSLDAGQALLLLTMLGDLDGAFAEAQLYDPANSYAPAYLFLPATAPMRADLRFMPLARKLGLADYWRSTGRWPDYCGEPGLPYDCKAEAARLAQKQPS